MDASRIEQHYQNVRKLVLVNVNKLEDAEFTSQVSIQLAFALVLDFKSKIQI